MQPTVVIGAGPYGLSIAAHLLGARLPTETFGEPMAFWQGMPAGMYLRSAWSASSLSAPDRACDLDSFLRATGRQQQQPIPLRFFVDYGLWFQRHAVPNVDPTLVKSLAADGADFSIELDDGRTLRASRVIVAVGIDRFANLPAFARGLPPSLASHTRAHRDFGRFKGMRIAVVGGGQSAIESAALLHEAGAHVELIVRHSIRWLKLHDYRGPGRRILYAPSDVGPPGLNWMLHFPLAFRLLPLRVQKAVTRRAVRPAGARWLIDRVRGRVPITSNRFVHSASPAPGGVRLELSDGTTRLVDHLVLATGYRPNLDRLDFMTPPLRQQIRQRDGFPVLNRWLESSVPGLHFAGGLADQSYGPICRFVSGAEVAARRIAACAARGDR
ncbi:MAG: NAD(P)/FAD-dependent oxidoreductase [Chloroflexi bacterium]|nr:MAG: NAD(P)/FAD-dependent oxidoreductase [Chloroflexota bacterium]